MSLTSGRDSIGDEHRLGILDVRSPSGVVGLANDAVLGAEMGHTTARVEQSETPVPAGAELTAALLDCMPTLDRKTLLKWHSYGTKSTAYRLS